MKLLTFAHRGEAQTFLSKLALKPVNEAQTFYKNDEYGLLITGEGIYEALLHLSATVATYRPKLIINYGIAGALNSDMALKKVYPVRTIYGYESTRPVFNSYTTQNVATLDCISSWQRVLTHEYALELAPFAELVDREAWGLGRVAAATQTPLQVYKLTSDYAGEQTDCFDLKQRAQEFSELLWEHFEKEFGEQEQKIAEATNHNEMNFPFHVSFTQKKQIQKFINKVPKHEFDKILNNAKDANSCITQLQIALHPLQEQIMKKLEALKGPFENIGAHLKFDPKLENKKVLLQMEINSAKNISNLTRVLSEFDYQELEQFWNGNFDV
ncbi:MAG: hypothetical protein CME62_04280 [Halobacteriovoraceae bacterium]|nr:hypothetical protein [Halobacteriovoraceae bacterium]